MKKNRVKKHNVTGKNAIFGNLILEETAGDGPGGSKKVKKLGFWPTFSPDPFSPSRNFGPKPGFFFRNRFWRQKMWIFWNFENWRKNFKNGNFEKKRHFCDFWIFEKKVFFDHFFWPLFVKSPTAPLGICVIQGGPKMTPFLASLTPTRGRCVSNPPSTKNACFSALFQ